MLTKLVVLHLKLGFVMMKFLTESQSQNLDKPKTSSKFSFLLNQSIQFNLSFSETVY